MIEYRTDAGQHEDDQTHSSWLAQEFAKRHTKIVEIGFEDVALAMGFDYVLFLRLRNPEMGQQKSDSLGFTRNDWQIKFAIIDAMVPEIPLDIVK